MIIHISGVPGSGKSTLGKNINKLYPKFIVYDTDYFLTKKDHEKIRKETSVKKSKKIWKTILDKKIKVFFTKHKDNIVVLVGDLNNGSPDGTRYKLTTNNINNIFYNVDLRTVMQRYYKRDVCDGLLKDKQFMDDILAGQYYIPSTKQFIAGYHNDVKWHKKEHYLFLNKKQIMNLMKQINTDYPANIDRIDTLFLISNEDDSVVSVQTEFTSFCNAIFNKQPYKQLHVVPFRKNTNSLIITFLDFIHELDYAVKEMLYKRVLKKIKRKDIKEKFNKAIKYFKLPTLNSVKLDL